MATYLIGRAVVARSVDAQLRTESEARKTKKRAANVAAFLKIKVRRSVKTRKSECRVSAKREAEEAKVP